jgi:hypothetical protein
VRAPYFNNFFEKTHLVAGLLGDLVSYQTLLGLGTLNLAGHIVSTAIEAKLERSQNVNKI